MVYKVVIVTVRVLSYCVVYESHWIFSQLSWSIGSVLSRNCKKYEFLFEDWGMNDLFGHICCIDCVINWNDSGIWLAYRDIGVVFWQVMDESNFGEITRYSWNYVWTNKLDVFDSNNVLNISPTSGERWQCDNWILRVPDVNIHTLTDPKDWRVIFIKTIEAVNTIRHHWDRLISESLAKQSI